MEAEVPLVLDGLEDERDDVALLAEEVDHKQLVEDHLGDQIVQRIVVTEPGADDQVFVLGHPHQCLLVGLDILPELVDLGRFIDVGLHQQSQHQIGAVLGDLAPHRM